MALDIAPIGDDRPSGENLEYEQVFIDLMLAAQPGEERQEGAEIVPAEEPSPREVAAAAEAVLAQSHDLRAAVHLAWARLRMEGLPGYAEVTGWMRRCLEDFWESCHPQLDAEDDDDPTARVNAVLGLADPATTLRALRLAPLTESRAFGAICYRDIQIAEGEIPAREGAEAPDPSTIRAAIRDTSDEALTKLAEAARAALDDLRAIDAVFAERTPGRGPDLSPVIRVLERICRRYDAETGGPEEAAEAEAAEAAGGPAPPAPAKATEAARGRIGEIDSPREVEEAIDRIISYYRKNEPSSPVPLLLGRARRLVGADFMTIVNDIAPEGVDHVRLVGGLGEGEQEQA